MILCGDCFEELKKMEAESIDSVVTDAPYGINFMAKHWDYDVPTVELWKEVLRVMKPGAHLLSFGGTRTYHRMVVAIEDAGFEIRDSIIWAYGSGFPKSLDVSKAIDKQAGVEREVISTRPLRGNARVLKGGNYAGNYEGRELTESYSTTAPATPSAKQWQGWGTALKPAVELICLARKPLSESTIAQNVLKHGTGGLNIDGCKVEVNEIADATQLRTMNRAKKETESGWGMNQNASDTPQVVSPQGRWPANLIHDGSEEVVRLFPNVASGVAVRHNSGGNTFGGDNVKPTMDDLGYADSGSASRFFYCAKASAYERNIGLAGMPLGEAPQSARSKPAEGKKNALGNPRANHHPTIKPVSLIRYLVRLVTPKGGISLDPFAGSCTHGIACKIEGMNFIDIEREAEYVEIGKARTRAWRKYVVIENAPEQKEVDESQGRLFEAAE